MSTAIYVEGSQLNETLLFSFGEDVCLDEMSDCVMSEILNEGLTAVKSYMVSSSDYLDVDLHNMMQEIQSQVWTW